MPRSVTPSSAVSLSLTLTPPFDALSRFLRIGEHVNQGARERRRYNVVLAAERDIARGGQLDVEVLRGGLEAGERLDLTDGGRKVAAGPVEVEDDVDRASVGARAPPRLAHLAAALAVVKTNDHADPVGIQPPPAAAPVPQRRPALFSSSPRTPHMAGKVSTTIRTAPTSFTYAKASVTMSDHESPAISR